MRRRLTLSILLGLALLAGLPARAQEDAGEHAVHVVQAGESLYRIALRYGVTIDEIAAANNIADSRRIYPGQQLRIPGASAAAESGEVLLNYVVQPGDTLTALAHRYGTTPERLSELNHLVSGARLFVGESLTVPQGSAAAAPVPRGYLHTVEEGDTLLSLAHRYGVAPRDITQANSLPDLPALFPGQQLVIPGGDAAPPLSALPDPIEEFVISPLPAAQGRTIGIRIRTSRPSTVTGAFMGRPINFITSDGLHHATVFGVHALTARGLYPLMVFARDEADRLVHAGADVFVAEVGYGRERVDIPARLQGLLDASVIQPELERLGSVMTAFNPQRYWGDGAFTKPVAGNVTSPFGTWRSYAELYETFHAGVDFGSPPGTPIYAPAAGRVVMVDQLPVRGNATVIDHGWGVYSGFWHQSRVNVEVGQVVEAGQVIGAVGSTGLSTGAHMHWEMWVSGVPVDPVQWLEHAFP